MSARMFLNQNGHLMPNTNNTYDLGANTSYRWRNIYGGTLSLTSYATVGSIVASDPGSSYYAYNNRIGNGLAVVGTTTLFGNVNPGANNSYDLGATGTRWRNIYTNDLNLSNKGSTNSVDNTWGDYTIQEGESDLFLINNRSGKKYKFNLTEVS